MLLNKRINKKLISSVLLSSIALLNINIAHSKVVTMKPVTANMTHNKALLPSEKANIDKSIDAAKNKLNAYSKNKKSINSLEREIAKLKRRDKVPRKKLMKLRRTLQKKKTADKKLQSELIKSEESLNTIRQSLLDAGKKYPRLNDTIITLHSIRGSVNTRGKTSEEGLPGTLNDVPSPKPPEGCFIATAAYGSTMEKDVVLLKQFRDKYLLTNTPGKWFVYQYYIYSPPVAAVISGHESLKLLTRILLTPLVFAVKRPYTFMFALIMLISLRVFMKNRYINPDKTIVIT